MQGYMCLLPFVLQEHMPQQYVRKYCPYVLQEYMPQLCGLGKPAVVVGLNPTVRPGALPIALTLAQCHCGGCDMEDVFRQVQVTMPLQWTVFS